MSHFGNEMRNLGPAVYWMTELRIHIDFNQYPIVQLLIQRGAILMTPEQTVKLIKMLTDKRTALGLSANEVARRAHLDPVAVWRIEQGMVAKPRAESLISIGRALDINPLEIFATVGWLTADDMPNLRTYMNAKYPDLPDTAIVDIEHYINTTLYTQRRPMHNKHDHLAKDHCPEKAHHCPHCPCAPKEA